MAAVLADRVDRPSRKSRVYQSTRRSVFCSALSRQNGRAPDCFQVFELPRNTHTPGPIHLPLSTPSSLLEPALAHSLQAPARSLHRRSGAHPVEHVRKPKITPRPGRTGPDSPVRHATPPIRQLTALELFRCLRRAPAKNQPTLPLVPSLSLLQRFSRAVRRSRILPIRPQFHFKIARKP
jgi:hypothetical protein